MRFRNELGLSGIAALITSALMLVSACSSGTSTIAEDVSVQKAYTLIQDNQSNDSFVILDIRTPGEYI